MFPIKFKHPKFLIGTAAYIIIGSAVTMFGGEAGAVFFILSTTFITMAEPYIPKEYKYWKKQKRLWRDTQ